jgi:hypothetical protein
MEFEDIQNALRSKRFMLSLHAEIEAEVENLAIAQITKALISGEILEEYPDTSRGESCLILGFIGEKPLHIVCGWRSNKLIIITVYIPRPPKFKNPRTRGEK